MQWVASRMYSLSCRVILGVLALSGGACVAAGEAPQAPATTVAQIIVAFRDPTFDPSRGDYLQNLSAETGVSLSYLRPMSGGAHVLQVRGGLDARSLGQLVARLAGRPEVRYAEEDRRLLPMHPR
jgi:hypothetical protein